MSTWIWLLAGFVLGIYIAFILSLLLFGRRESARAIAGFVPDCSVLLARLLREPELPRRRRLVLVLVIGYLAMPFDLVPDFLPVIGYLDDAIVVALAMRWLLRSVGHDRLELHWPGPDESFRVLLRLAGA
jgi:uncharacterized membrane protein YkvA (DUF1232 family)